MSQEQRADRGRLSGPLLALYGANAISFVGNNVATIAIPWFVLVTTGSAAKTGITAAFSILPVIIAGIFGGAIVDRLGYRRASIIADLASGGTVAGIAFCHSLDVLSFPLLLALVFLGALLDAPGGTARSALVPDLATQQGVPIERASSLIQVVERGSRVIGAPLGGILIAVFNPVGALWIDAASFAISAGMVYFLVPSPPHAATESSSAGYFTDLKSGFAFIRQDRLIFTIVLTVMVTNFLDAAFGMVAMPYLAKTEFDSSLALGLIYAASGGGAVIGALTYGAIGHRRSRRSVFIPAYVLVASRALAVAFIPSLPVVLLIQVLGGIAAGPINPILFSAGFERIPANMRGRVLGALTAGGWVAMPAGVLVGGYLIELTSLPVTFLLIGICGVATTMSLFVNPAIHDLDRPRE